jgi:hypothetical protein
MNSESHSEIIQPISKANRKGGRVGRSGAAHHYIEERVCGTFLCNDSRFVVISKKGHLISHQNCDYY